MKPETHRNATSVERAATAGVAALATGSFALSYDALHELAVANQVPKPLAWIWPLIVDGFIIVASLAILHAVQRGRTARYPWTLLVAFSALSVAFNVLHAPPTPIARLVAAVPPLTLVLSFELLMRQRRDPTTTTVEAHPVLVPQNADVRLPAETRETTYASGAVETAGHSLLNQAREIHARHCAEGARLTGKSLGQILGVSDGYARRLLREIGATQDISTAAGASSQLMRVSTSSSSASTQRQDRRPTTLQSAGA